VGTPTPNHPADCAILIVDDEVHLLGLYQQILEDEGYVVKTASTRTAAVEILKNYTPRFIFLDCRMGGMSNAAFKHEVDKIQAGKDRSRIVGFSSFSPDSTFAEEMRTTLDGFVEKPNDLDGFLEAVKGLCFNTPTSA